MRPLRLALALALALAILAACGSDGALAPEEVKLANAEAKWSATGISSYSMRQSRHCYCITGGKEYQLVVVNNVIVSGSNVDTGEPLAAPELTWFRTIPQLFDEVRTAQPVPGVLREATYHATQGYPTVVSLDPLPNAIDDEVSYITSIVAQ